MKKRTIRQYKLEAQDNGGFVCHKSPRGDRHMCNGWYTRYKDNQALLKLADQYGVLQKVPAPKG